MPHPDNSTEIEKVRAYIAAVEGEVNHLNIVPRSLDQSAFDSVGLGALSKMFALAKASLALLDADFPDEAYGLSRSQQESGRMRDQFALSDVRSNLARQSERGVCHVCGVRKELLVTPRASAICRHTRRARNMRARTAVGHRSGHESCQSPSDPGPVAYLPIPLQRNSNSLQRNSNITASEFQQLHHLWGRGIFCSGGFSRRMAANGGF